MLDKVQNKYNYFRREIFIANDIFYQQFNSEHQRDLQGAAAAGEVRSGQPERPPQGGPAVPHLQPQHEEETVAAGRPGLQQDRAGLS